MEWVEVRGKTVDVAVEAALQELGIDNRDQAEVEVLQEPEKGFLGLGGKDAIVRVKPKAERKRRRRRRKTGGKRGDEERPRGGGGNGGQKPNRSRNAGGQGNGQGRGGGSRTSDKRSQAGRQQNRRPREEKKESPAMSIDDQAAVVKSFLEGLVGAFGLEGEVAVSVDDDVIIADVRGPQTEAMVGPRGSVIEAVHELSKTVLHRQTQSSARLRLDIAGYAERRRQALTIYAGQLIDQVLEEGGEVMLEPMSAGDRKVIHDAVADREGVRSFSEGEAPRRYVVIATTAESQEEE